MPTNKGIAPLVLLIIVAALLAGGGYAVVKTNPGIAQKLGFEKSEKEGEIADQKNWKTYTNEKNGFELKYPSGWKTQSSEGKIYFFDPAKESEEQYLAQYAVTVSYAANPKKLTGQQWFEANIFPTEKEVIGQTSIDGIPALKTSESGMNEIIVVYVGKNSSVFSISMNKQSGYVDVFEKILSTFKFTSPATTATSDWKTYTNTQYGFSFKYPVSIKEIKSGIGISSDLGIEVIVNNPQFIFNININPAGTGYAGWSNYHSLEEIVVDNIKAKISYLKNDESENSYLIRSVIEKESVYIDFYTRIDGNDLAKKEEVFKQILSTFKFTK